jgi:hypothetical protein
MMGCKMKSLTIISVVLMVVFSCLRAQVVINEVFTNVVDSDAGNEWVELYNNNPDAVEITDWEIDCDVLPYFTIPSFTLDAYSYVVIYLRKDGVNSSTAIYTGSSFGSSNMRDDYGQVTLYRSSSHKAENLVDFVEWGRIGEQHEDEAIETGQWPSSPDFAPAVEEGHSIEYDGDGNSGADWFDQANPTPGLDNSLPVELNSFTATPVENKMVILHWVTQSEVNNHGFYVMRSETEDGIYEAISPFIPGAGTSTEKHQYSFDDKRVELGKTYWYKLKQEDVDGMVVMHGPVKVELPGKGESYAPIVPAETGLVANFPNPFNPATTVSVQIADEADVGISIYDVLGHHVSQLFAGRLTAGQFDFNWNGSTDRGQEAPSGVYFCILQTRDGHTSSLKLVKMK